MKAIDRFAGTGWGVALKQLDIQEDGVEIMPEAVATREAAGMTTIFNDVWDGLEGSANAAGIDFGSYDLAIDSPPCQTFSVGGNGVGREALDTIHGLIQDRAYERPDLLREFGQEHDPRTALVMIPIAYAFRDRTPIIVLEQVPTVLPLWQAYAEVLRGWGYSVWTGILNAEQYGVPQTRRRAILIAKLHGEAKMPTPTHSRYYARTPSKMDEGVLPWVSMASALGWGITERPCPAVQTFPRAATWSIATGDMNARMEGSDRPLVSGAAAGPEVWYNRPATTLMASSDVVAGPGYSDPKKGGVSRQNRPGSVRVTPQEAAILQSYESNFPFQGTRGKKFLQIGNAVPPLLAKAIIEEAIS